MVGQHWALTVSQKTLIKTFLYYILHNKQPTYLYWICREQMERSDVYVHTELTTPTSLANTKLHTTLHQAKGSTHIK